MRIVVRAKDGKVAREVHARLAAAGIKAVNFAETSPAEPRADIFLLCDPEPSSPDDSLIALEARTLADPPPPGLAAQPPRAGAIAVDAPADALAAQLRAWKRIAIAEDECVRRSATAALMGIAAPCAGEAPPVGALYVGAPNATFLTLSCAMDAEGGHLSAAFSAFAGLDHLHDQRFDAVILNGLDDLHTALTVCAGLRRNAALYHLPTMVLAAADEDAAAAYQRGAVAVGGPRNACGAAFGWLFEAIRRERRRRAAEQRLHVLRDLLGEARTGLWRRDAFLSHLSRLADDHQTSGRPLALASLRIVPPPGGREPSAEVWRRSVAEIASLAGRLARDTDSVAALDGDVIAVALPASGLEAARRTARRIAAVAECTAFVSNAEAGPLVFEQSAIELQCGEGGAALLSRALRVFELDAIPA